MAKEGKCPNCGAAYPDKSSRCPKCAADAVQSGR